MTDLMCPLCNYRPVVIMTCDECWIRQDYFTETERARIILFGRSVVLPEGHRHLFNGLKTRLRLL
jgi:hypothetical protein